MYISRLTSYLKETFMPAITPKFELGDAVSHISPTIDFQGIVRRIVTRPGTRQTIVLVESESKQVWIPIALLEKLECES